MRPAATGFESIEEKLRSSGLRMAPRILPGIFTQSGGVSLPTMNCVLSPVITGQCCTSISNIPLVRLPSLSPDSSDRITRLAGRIDAGEERHESGIVANRAEVGIGHQPV